MKMGMDFGHQLKHHLEHSHAVVNCLVQFSPPLLIQPPAAGEGSWC